ncbi:UvrD-helicase domain-containing protein [Nocardia bovistercoris]|uniref:UvrD-helicase domain-containing protein n=1 Tax=Nocardia bovistercoris TaxID=2785916 RepID=UPI001E39F2A0|nr:UvrD-helicase domain-containing protein [Nocardia bovistercoris]
MVTPYQVAEALGLPPPTEEQAAVIAAPAGPTLVVAGAGAGKTETMAARVVWMVANRLVAPDQVLGLTFTRKAAQQLTSRIRTRLARLSGSALLRELDPTGELRIRLSGAEPEISTYHSYAGRLLTQHGLLLPVEPSSVLLTETQLWQVAHQVVRTWDGDLETDRTPVSVTEAVLALSGQLAEHLVEPEQLAEAHIELEKLVHTLPPGPRQRGGPSQALLGPVQVQRERVALLPLVRQLHAALRRRGALDFGAQMSLAARLAAEHPEVAAAERTRFRLVLLDEYQDTGHAQRILLAALFGGAATHDTAPSSIDATGHPVSRRVDAASRDAASRDAASRDAASRDAASRDAAFRDAVGAAGRLAVTAVGDPMQSIYGWRGASAANLPRFATDFPSAPGVPAPTLPLLTSWRNPPEALALANLVAEPLRRGALDRGGVTVDALRAKPGADSGVVAFALTETVVQERDWLAERIAAEWAARKADGAAPPTSAVLVRRNADAAPLAEALREQGLPVEIVGLGGLLATPEVADIVATLRLVAEPAAGSAAMRILTGARWRIGVTDIAALAKRARELSISRSADPETERITDAGTLARALREVAPEPAEQAGLADAIADPGPAQNYSESGFARIEVLGEELSALRERGGQPLTELVADVERTIGVGVETQARRAMAGTGAGREHLDAFAEVVAGYAADSGASLSGLLAFLAAAESVENGLEPGEVEVARDRVQVLTVHAAKGLEWEVVAVPHVAHGVFPSTTASGSWLGALAELPTALRGDRVQEDSAEGVPVLDLSDLADRSDLERAIKSHKQALDRRRMDEDRRLFYVAVTRTERVLLLSAHHWAETGAKPKGPSDFLLELKAAAESPDSPVHGAVDITRWDDPPPPDAANPFTDNPPTAEWPRDPLGPRRPSVEAGAAMVRAALAALRNPPPPSASRTTEPASRDLAATASSGSDEPADQPAQSGGSAPPPLVMSGLTDPRASSGGRADLPSSGVEPTGRSTAESERTETSASFESDPTPTSAASPAPPPAVGQPTFSEPVFEEFLSPPDDFEPPPDDFYPPEEDYLPPPDDTFSPAPPPEDTAPAEFPTDPEDPDGWAADVDALLAEFEAESAVAREVELPGRIPATALVEMRADPAKLARRLRRPLPFPPNPLARRGTAFHAWVQRWFAGPRLLGLDELPGETVDGHVDTELVRMQDAFLDSAWAHRTPQEVEIAFETSIAGVVVRGRMDAVFAEPDGGWIVVDWKTGAEPGEDDEPAVAMQLAIYRVALARLMAARTGESEQRMLERIGAAFHYVRSGRTVAPRELPGPDELAELVRSSAPPRGVRGDRR